MSSMDALVGKMVTGILVSPDHQYLEFETNEGPVAFYAEGDCCSTSWFNDLLGIDTLIGSAVVSTHARSLPDVPNTNLVRVYSIVLVTCRGVAEVIFRNESNGYYGGWCESIEVRQGKGRDELVRIADDWSADA